MSDASPLRSWLEHDGALLRLRLSRPKANLVDAAMIAELQAAFDACAHHGALRGVLLDAEGATSVSAPASKSICLRSARRCSPRCMHCC